MRELIDFLVVIVLSGGMVFETLLAMYWHKKFNECEELLRKSGYVWSEKE